MFDDDGWDAAALAALDAFERAPPPPRPQPMPLAPPMAVQQPIMPPPPPPFAQPVAAAAAAGEPAWVPHAAFRPQLCTDAVPAPSQHASAAAWGPWAAARAPRAADLPADGGGGLGTSGLGVPLEAFEPPAQPRPPPQTFDPAAIDRWIYPTNVTERAYQFEIASIAVRARAARRLAPVSGRSRPVGGAVRIRGVRMTSPGPRPARRCARTRSSRCRPAWARRSSRRSSCTTSGAGFPQEGGDRPSGRASPNTARSPNTAWDAC